MHTLIDNQSVESIRKTGNFNEKIADRIPVLEEHNLPYDQMEEEASAIIEKIDDMGGMLAAIERHFPQQEVADAAYRYQKEIEEQRRTMVGVNKYATEEALPVEILRIDEELEWNQIEKTNRIKNDRNNSKIRESLERLGEACSGEQNVMDPITAAAKASATLQEICDVFRKTFGEYRDPGIY